MERSSQMRALVPLRTHRSRASERSRGTARTGVPDSGWPFALAWALCLLLPYGCSLTRRSIGEALADDAPDGALGALYVIYAKSDAVAIAEIELGEIAVQVFLAAMLVHAFHAALEDRVEPFDGVGVGEATHVFINGMIDGFMPRELASEHLEPSRLIGHHGG